MFTPTGEQEDALGLFASGVDMVIQAGAGTGKTSTLVLLAEDSTGRGQYVVFNKAAALDAMKRFPVGVGCSTMHSIAARATDPELRARLGKRREPSWVTADHLGIKKAIYFSLRGRPRALQPSWLSSHVMRALKLFCRSADREPGPHHFPVVDNLDVEDDHPNNRALADMLMPYLDRAWADVQRPDGKLRFEHDHYMKCQPAGTLVRRVISRMPTAWEDVPIEDVRPGDVVVSWKGSQRRGFIRRQGRAVTAAGRRDYSGDLVTLTTERGRSSSYTPNHRCIVRLDAPLTEGNFVVYLARRGESFRVGRTTWRTRSQSNTLGIRRRAENQQADAMWILSVHSTDRDAALAEALVGHQFNIPTWQFRSPNETMPCAEFWAKVGPNRSNARVAASAHGRDLRFPFWERGAGWEKTVRPVEMRACNLLDGMLVCEMDEVAPDDKGALWTHDGRGGWSPIEVRRGPYSGLVYSLDVEADHTYVADGIVTHNSWALSGPQLPVDFLLVDEAQDLAPVEVDVFSAQECQTVWVGDSCQQIYQWRGAVDALSSVDADVETFLTRSFRFGNAIAAMANDVLGLLPTKLRLEGNPQLDSTVTRLSDPKAILCRTNAVSVEHVMRYRQDARRVHLVGGGAEVIDFARAAIKLREGRQCDHIELGCFASWEAVQQYVMEDPLGGELKLLVNLVDQFGPDAIIEALEDEFAEDQADIVVSTAHKAKGREWDTVQLAGDFPDFAVATPEEFRLYYVAVTRARHVIDPFNTEMFRALSNRRSVA